jgi:ribosomal protein L28
VTSQVLGDAERSLFNIAQRNPGLTHVQLKDMPVGITDAVLHALAEHCTGLRAVELSCANLVTDASVVALARACPRLHTLTLHRCTKLTNHSIKALVNHCRDLCHLDVRDSMLVSASALKTLLRICAHLHCLKISSASMTQAAVQRLQRRNLTRCVWVTRTQVPFSIWVAAKAVSVVSVLSRRHNVASVVPATGLDNVCV